jgi:integrase
MQNELLPEIEALGQGWPSQVIARYDNYWKIWRSQFSTQTAPGTEEHYTKIGEHWCAFANGKDLNPRLMLEWHLHVTDMRHPFSKALRISAQRVIRHHYTVKKFLGWLKVMNVIGLDPSMALPKVKMPAPLPPKKWEHFEYQAIVKHGARLPHRNVHTWLTILGYHSGMSIKDCALLKWDEVVLVDDGPCFIQKMRAKMASRLGAKALCTIPIIPGGELWVWIKRLEGRRHRAYKRNDGMEYVHQDAPGYYACDHPTISERMRTFFAEALGWKEMKDRSFRNLRNSFCSRLVNSGADTVLVSKMTGHQRLEQLSDYVQPDIRAMQDAMVRALQWIEKDSGPDLKPRFLTLPAPDEQLEGAAIT